MVTSYDTFMYHVAIYDPFANIVPVTNHNSFLRYVVYDVMFIPCQPLYVKILSGLLSPPPPHHHHHHHHHHHTHTYSFLFTFSLRMRITNKTNTLVHTNFPRRTSTAAWNSVRDINHHNYITLTIYCSVRSTDSLMFCQVARSRLCI